MADVKIEIRTDGPYRVHGEVELVDAEGNRIEPSKNPFSLCRCGASTNKPFCDGTHSQIGFKGAQQAVAEAERAEAADDPSI